MGEMGDIADLRPTITALRAEQDYLLSAIYLKHDATAETAELLSSAYLLYAKSSG